MKTASFLEVFNEKNLVVCYTKKRNCLDVYVSNEQASC